MLGLFNILAVHSDQLSSLEVVPRTVELDRQHVVLGYADGSLRLWSLGIQLPLKEVREEPCQVMVIIHSHFHSHASTPPLLPSHPIP
jgi:hypothetical protein